MNTLFIFIFLIVSFVSSTTTVPFKREASDPPNNVYENVSHKDQLTPHELTNLDLFFCRSKFCQRVREITIEKNNTFTCKNENIGILFDEIHGSLIERRSAYLIPNKPFISLERKDGECQRLKK
jgi:hypothetical protein